MIFNPPHYEWEAKTVREACDYLDAAKDLLDAHMASLHPSRVDRRATERATPIGLKLSLDLSGLVERINDKRTVEAIAADFDDTEAL